MAITLSHLLLGIEISWVLLPGLDALRYPASWNNSIDFWYGSHPLIMNLEGMQGIGMMVVLFPLSPYPVVVTGAHPGGEE